MTLDRAILAPVILAPVISPDLGPVILGSDLGSCDLALVGTTSHSPRHSTPVTGAFAARASPARRAAAARVWNRTKRRVVISSHDKRSTQGDAKVRQASFHELIQRALRDHYAAVMAEPIPRQWLDVLNRLAQQEREASPRANSPIRLS